MAEIKFCVVANPRTGSNHFIEMLNSHPDITCHREVFHPHTVYLYDGESDEMLDKRERDPLKFLEELYDSSSNRACGLKIFDSQNSEVLDKVLYDPTIKKIVLYRPNFLAVYSSERIAEAEKIYLSLSHEAAVIDPFSCDPSMTSKKILFDQARFRRQWSSYRAYYKYVLDVLNETMQENLFITYEELLNESLVRRIFTFIQLSQPKAIKSRLRKQNTSDILARFQNPEVVRTYLESIDKMNWTNEGFTLW